MLPDRVSNPGLLTYESGTLPIALRGPAVKGGRRWGWGGGGVRKGAVDIKDYMPTPKTPHPEKQSFY